MPAVGEIHGTGGHPAGVPPASDSRRWRVGIKYCRWCDKRTTCKADKIIMFREIPAGSMFFGAGTYWRGPYSNGDVWGSGHANRRFLCNKYDKVRQRQEALAETSVHQYHSCCPPTSFAGCVSALWSTKTTCWKPSRWLRCSVGSCAVTVPPSSSLRRCSMECTATPSAVRFLAGRCGRKMWAQIDG